MEACESHAYLSACCFACTGRSAQVSGGPSEKKRPINGNGRSLGTSGMSGARPAAGVLTKAPLKSCPGKENAGGEHGVSKSHADSHVQAGCCHLIYTQHSVRIAQPSAKMFYLCTAKCVHALVRECSSSIACSKSWLCPLPLHAQCVITSCKAITRLALWSEHLLVPQSWLVLIQALRSSHPSPASLHAAL